MSGGQLTMWHIFTYPADFPKVPFVIRVEYVDGGKVIQTPERWLRMSLKAARRVVWANDPSATVRIARYSDDVPSLVETWL